MLHKPKHGAYLELVGRPESWCRRAVASVQWGAAKFCEWKVRRRLSRTALPLRRDWKLYWVSFLRRCSEAGLGSGPGSGWACGRWVRSPPTFHRTRESWEEFVQAFFLLAFVLPCQQARKAVLPKCGGRERRGARGSEWVIAARGISCCKLS